MSNSKRPKAFFLNGGMGRIISAIPALEKYYEAKEDPDFIIVIEGICNICLLYTSDLPTTTPV